MSGDLAELDRWLQDFARRLSPSERRKLGLSMMREGRRANMERIAQNVQPDGSAMEARKPRRTNGKRNRGRDRRMFRKLRLARNLKIRADGDGAELSFATGQKVAAEHHFGKVGFVGRTRDGRVIRTRFPARELLGWSEEDKRRLMDAAIDHLAK